MNQSVASYINLRERCFVRLACVKHAASVHPEPGSNSQIKICPVQKLAWLIIRNVINCLLICFPGCKSSIYSSWNFKGIFGLLPYQSNQYNWFDFGFSKNSYILNFQGCFTVQLSRFLCGFQSPPVPCFFVGQRTILYQSIFHLSTLFSNIFWFFWNVVFSWIFYQIFLYIIIRTNLSKILFQIKYSGHKNNPVIKVQWTRIV